MHTHTCTDTLKADIAKTLSKNKNTHEQADMTLAHAHTLTSRYIQSMLACSHIIHVYTQTHTYKQK